jgi:hypothetical protein
MSIARQDSDPLLHPIVAEVVYVYGIRIPNAEAALLTRRVITMSLFLLFVQAIISIVQVLSLGQYYSLSSAALCMVVPMCGYFGAKWRNKMLLSGFAFCNCMTCVGTPVLVVVMITFTEFLRTEFPTVCPPGEKLPLWPDDMTDPVINGKPATCDSIQDLLDGMSTVYAIIIPLAIVSTAVAALSCTWGWRLTTMPYFVQPKYATDMNNAPVATTTFLRPDQVSYAGNVYGQGERKEKYVPDIV